jgi:hypothetical protein
MVTVRDDRHHIVDISGDLVKLLQRSKLLLIPLRISSAVR